MILSCPSCLEETAQSGSSEPFWRHVALGKYGAGPSSTVSGSQTTYIEFPGVLESAQDNPPLGRLSKITVLGMINVFGSVRYSATLGTARHHYLVTTR
jgi:hypothetical protein